MGTALKASFYVCFIKAIFPLINYDDEPSVSKGIVSQLPSYHLPYTECRPSSLTGSCPMEKIDASYSSCFCVWLLLTHTHLPWCWFTQRTRYHCRLLLVCFADAVCFRLHRLRVSVPEPCPVSDACYQRLGRALECIACILFSMQLTGMVQLLGVWYPSTSSADHMLSLSSGSCRSPLVSCRQSQSMTASF